MSASMRKINNGLLMPCCVDYAAPLPASKPTILAMNPQMSKQFYTSNLHSMSGSIQSMKSLSISIIIQK